MDWSFDNLTSEQRERLAHVTKGLHVGGFYVILVARLLDEPPPALDTNDFDASAVGVKGLATNVRSCGLG